MEDSIPSKFSNESSSSSEEEMSYKPCVRASYKSKYEMSPSKKFRFDMFSQERIKSPTKSQFSVNITNKSKLSTLLAHKRSSVCSEQQPARRLDKGVANMFVPRKQKEEKQKFPLSFQQEIR